MKIHIEFEPEDGKMEKKKIVGFCVYDFLVG